MSQTRPRPLPAHLVALLVPVAGTLALAIGCTGGDAGTDGDGVDAVPQRVEDRVVVLLVPGFDPDLAERWRGDLRGLELLSPGRTLVRVQPELPLASAAGLRQAGAGASSWGTGGAALDPASMQLRSGRAALQDGLAAQPPFWVRAAEQGVSTQALWLPSGTGADPVAGLDLLASPAAAPGGLDTAVLLSPGAVLPGAGAVDTVVRMQGEPPWEATLPLDGGQSFTLTVSALKAGAVQVSAGGLHLDVRMDEVTAPVAVDLPTGPATVRLAAARAGDGLALAVVAAASTPADATYAGAWAARHDPVDPTGGSEGLLPAVGAGVVSPLHLARELQQELESDGAALVAELERGDRKLVVARLPQADVASQAFLGFSDPGHPGWNAELASRLGGEVKATYAAVDSIIERVRGTLQPGDRLFLVSPYGVQPIRNHVDLNALLVLGKRLTLAGAVDRAIPPALDDAADWTKTNAYAVGAGALRLNVVGRESAGTVPADRVDRERAALAEWLGGRKHEGKPLFAEVLDMGAAPDGAPADRPDIVVRFAPGFGPSPLTAAGRVAADVVTPNKTALTGGPGGLTVADAAGFVAVSGADVGGLLPLSDLSPTVLQALGLPADGTAWAAPTSEEAPAQ
ncbi:MAG: alkaline phosphatase family protein [Alphaproteobacteria bacterium]|nr:alkaline phosphatase family protein [Alphaproteobacteria bacterium]